MNNSNGTCIGLISAPWPIYSRPSIQLATLKAYLRAHFPEITVASHHFYLTLAESLGYRVYQEICERTWLAESVYAALLYPEQREKIQRLFQANVKTGSVLRAIDFADVTRQVQDVTDGYIDTMDWDRYALLGFSICLCQFTASLYMIARIKQRSQALPIVIGGSMFAGDTLGRLVNTFPDIDFAVNGEGERPLVHLVEHLKTAGPKVPLTIPGIVSRQAAKPKNAPSPGRNQLENLAGLPQPDFDDYFALLERFPGHKRFFPTLAVEMSRGCWWRHKNDGTPASGCAFCNLNLQWQGYRYKPPRQVRDEIEHLTSKHQTLSVAFMDNLLPLKPSEALFEALMASQKDLRLFCEIRATTSRRVLEKMKLAGVSELQIGIEALSSRLLKKMNKGTSVIQNLEIMRDCEELGLLNASNLILHFPGSDEADVQETLNAIDFALPFRPMRVVQFWLGLGSPVWQNPAAFGIQTVFNHHHWAVLLPPRVAASLVLPIQSYRGDRMRQRKLWQPVTQKVRRWKQTYDKLHQGAISEPILSFRDGGEFLIIRQKRLGDEPMTHRLVGTSRQIYLFCRQAKPLQKITDHFPAFGQDRILSFLKMMVDMRLMYTENLQYLSLAVSSQPILGRGPCQIKTAAKTLRKK